MDVAATEEDNVEFDQCLQDVGGTGDGIAGFEFFGWNGQKAVMGTEDAQFAGLAFVEVLGGYLHLAWGDFWCAVKADGGDTLGTIEKFCVIKMGEEFALSPTIDVF